MKYPGFIGPAYRSQSEFADGEDLVNWYIEQMESPNAKSKLALYPSPGMDRRALIAASPGRGLFAEANRVFAVVGPQLIQVNADWTTTDRGTLPIDTNQAVLTTNGEGGGDLMVISGGAVLNLDLSTFVLTNTGVAALQGGMVDGYFIALDPTSSKLRISNLLDGLTWDPTQFAQRATASDPWRALIVSNQRLYLHGERTSEVWYNAGNFPFPFAPIQGGTIPYGIAAAFSSAEYQGNPIWLTQNKNGDRLVVRATGYSSAARVSTHALEYALRQYAKVDDAEAMVYQEDGHAFYVLTFPTANSTWVYDDEGSWHRRGWWNASAMRFDAWRPRAHAFGFGTHLVVDVRGGGLYALSNAYGLDMDGAAIRRVRRAPALYNEGKRQRYPGLELALDTGVAVPAGQGSDPIVMLRKSRDGGKTWGAERARRAGKIGDYNHRVRWNRCGSGVNVAFEVSVSDPIPWRLTDAYLRQPGEHP